MNHRRAIFSKTSNMNILHPRKFSCLLRFTLYQNVEETYPGVWRNIYLGNLCSCRKHHCNGKLSLSAKYTYIPQHPLYLDTSTWSKEHINHSSFAQSGLSTYKMFFSPVFKIPIIQNSCLYLSVNSEKNHYIISKIEEEK